MSRKTCKVLVTGIKQFLIQPEMCDLVPVPDDNPLAYCPALISLYEWSRADE